MKIAKRAGIGKARVAVARKSATANATSAERPR
jgi:hypothetical protein